jgi:hypothetical protein
LKGLRGTICDFSITTPQIDGIFKLCLNLKSIPNMIDGLKRGSIQKGAELNNKIGVALLEHPRAKVIEHFAGQGEIVDRRPPFALEPRKLLLQHEVIEELGKLVAVKPSAIILVAFLLYDPFAETAHQLAEVAEPLCPHLAAHFCQESTEDVVDGLTQVVGVVIKFGVLHTLPVFHDLLDVLAVPVGERGRVRHWIIPGKVLVNDFLDLQ